MLSKLTITKTRAFMQRAKKPALTWKAPKGNGSILLRMSRNTRASPTTRPHTAPSLLAFFQNRPKTMVGKNCVTPEYPVRSRLTRRFAWKMERYKATAVRTRIR